MLIPLGIIASAGVSAGSFDLLETQVLGSSQTTITFASLSGLGSTYKHLQIRAVTRNTSTAGGGNTYGANGIIRFNGVSTSSYRTHYLQGDGSSAVSGDYGSVTGVYVQDLGGSWDSNTANQFAASVIDILDPFDTNKNTTTRGLTGVSRIQLDSGAWFNTAAITNITITQDGSQFKQGSRFSLYGIKGA